MSLSIVVLGLGLGILFGVATDAGDELVLPDLPPVPSASHQLELTAIRAGAGLVPGGTVRRVFNYSVIPGGVYSAAEAEGAAQSDHVVAGHYRDVVLSTLFVRNNPAPRAVHVSYRVGDQVYWTRRKVILHAGESMLTDGINEVRARCGNRVSPVPRAPVLPEDPPLEELVLPYGDHEFPTPPLLASREIPIPTVPNQPTAYGFDPPPPGPPVPPPPVPPVPPAPVPEPGTVLLIGSGLAVMALRRLRRQKR
jgi:hypothetical protein